MKEKIYKILSLYSFFQFQENLILELKDEFIVDKIASGKLKKFLDENCLLTQKWVMDPEKKVADIINDFGNNKVEINEFYRLKIGE